MRKTGNFSPLTKQEILKVRKIRKTRKFSITPKQEVLEDTGSV